MGSFWAKYILFEFKKYRGVIFHETGRGIQNLERNRILISKLALGISQNLSGTLKNLKNVHFNWLLLGKVYIL